MKENGIYRQSKAQIALIEHPRPDNPKRAEDVVNAPLSACLMTGYMAALLEKNDLKTDIIDANLKRLSINDTFEMLMGASYKVIGIRLVYLWEKTEEIFALLERLCNAGITAHISLYGHYSTFAYKSILKRFPFIDSVVVGEPEYTFLELSSRIVGTDGNVELSGIDGLVSRDIPNSLVPRDQISDLDALPFPDRRDMVIANQKGIVTYILASRGCYNNCGFCYLNPFYGDNATWRGRSAKNVFDEIKQLYNDHGCDNFYFADASFFGNAVSGKARARDLANLIIDDGLNISIGLESRANDIEKDVISLLIKAGLRNLFLGVESGDQTTLDGFKKKTTVEINKNAISIVRDCGIEPNVGFIMFGKDTEINGIRKNFTFLKEMGLMKDPYTTAHLLCHKQSIFLGTPDYSGDNGHFKPCDPDGYEKQFDYTDKRMSSLVDITSSLCNNVFSIVANYSRSEGMYSEDCFCKDTDMHENSFLSVLNTTIINMFDQTLLSFEKGALNMNKQAIVDLKKEHTAKLKELAVC